MGRGAWRSAWQQAGVNGRTGSRESVRIAREILAPRSGQIWAPVAGESSAEVTASAGGGRDQQASGESLLPGSQQAPLRPQIEPTAVRDHARA